MGRTSRYFSASTLPMFPAGRLQPLGAFLFMEGALMAWIESHQDLGQHPKTLALAATLNERVTTIVGVLHLLWHFTLKFSWRDGDLSKFTPKIIADCIYWHGDPDSLVKALQDTGWMKGMVIHDWLDYAGKIVKDRRYNEERRKTTTNDVPHRKSTATLPYPTLPKTKKRNIKEKTFTKPTEDQIQAYCLERKNPVNPTAFWNHYEANGWKVGKNGMRDWKAAVRTWEQSTLKKPEPKKELVL